MSSRIIVVFALIALAGCSSSSGGTGGGAGGGAAGGKGGGSGGAGGGFGGAGGAGGGATDAGTQLSQSQLCPSYVKAYCDREIGCAFLDAAKRSDCEARITAQCATALKRITAGLQTYNPSKGGACVDFVKGDSCDQGRNFFSGGDAYLYGCLGELGAPGTALGGVCELSADCVSGTCVGTAPGCKTCRSYVAAGMPCDFSTRACDPTAAYCRLGADAGRECSPFVSVGSLCTAAVTCDPATSSGCASGFSDAGTADGGARKCLPFLADGERCSFSTECLSKRCNRNGLLDGGVNTCGLLPLSAPCAANPDCGASNFCDGLSLGPTVPGVCNPRIPLGTTCKIQNVDPNDGCLQSGNCFESLCKLPGGQQLGQQCGFTSDCVNTAQCGAAADGGIYGICVVRLNAGQTCLDDSQCVLGSICSGVCKTLSTAGGPCAANADCKELLSCPAIDAGTGSFSCANYAMPGSPCGTNTVCSTATAIVLCATVDAGTVLSDGGAAKTQVCTVRAADGASATGDSQCTSGRCVAADGGFCTATNVGTCAPTCVP